MNKLREFFSTEDQASILQSIAKAEKETSGEIRLRIEKTSGKDPVDAAREAFVKLGMRDTELHNGILFYLSLEDKKFAIVGDDGINDSVPDDFWDTVVDTVLSNFKKGSFVEGLSKGIALAGEQLASYYPCQPDDVNELPDAISFEDEEKES